MLSDKHVIKAQSNTCQLLCNVHQHITPNRKDIPYKAVNINHKISIWARTSRSNYIWILKMLYYQNREYIYRFNKQHKTNNTSEWLRDNIPNIIDIGLTPFPLLVPDKYKTENIVESYRNYYMNEKYKNDKYTRRRLPKWLKL